MMKRRSKNRSTRKKSAGSHDPQKTATAAAGSEQKKKSEAIGQWIDRFCQLAGESRDSDDGISHLMVPEEYRESIGDILTHLEKRIRNRGNGDDGTANQLPRLLEMLEEAGMAGLTDAASGWRGFSVSDRVAILDHLASSMLHGDRSAGVESLRETGHLLHDLVEAGSSEIPDLLEEKFWALEPRYRLLLLDLFTEESGEKALLFFSRLAGREPQVDLTMVEKALGIPTDASVRLLHDIETRSDDKKVSKAVGQALYRLRSRGVKAAKASAERDEPTASPLSFETATELQAFASGIDWQGHRLVLLAGLPGTRGYAVAQSLLGEQDGVREFAVWRMSRAELRDMVNKANRKSNLLLQPVSERHAFFLLEESFLTAREAGKEPPDEFLHWRTENFWQRIDPGSYEHPAYDDVGIPSVDETALLRENWNLLLDSGPIAGWTMGPRESAEAYRAFRGRSEQTIITPGDYQKEREQTAFDSILEGYFTPQRMGRFQRRLEEMAYLFRLMGQEEEARLSRIASAAFCELTDRIPGHPFAVALIRRDLERQHQLELKSRGEDVRLIQSPWSDQRGR